MMMQQDNKDFLEQSRSDKIKKLGFLCYNLYVDGVMVFPEMNGIIEEIKKALDYMMMLRRENADLNYQSGREEMLNEKLIELGCVCFNLYVDNKLFNTSVLSLCDSISSINFEIAGGLQPACAVGASEEKKNTTSSKFKVTCPEGMEPIPVNFKKCVCGYRNKSVAVFCGKCGAKLQ